MSRMALLVVALTAAVPAFYAVAHACGDKFLMVGRGAKFQRAYASVHPGKVLIFGPPSTDSKAAIRDSQLHRALRQAGHAVSVIEDWTLLEQALKTVPIDVILVDAGEAARLRTAIGSSPTAPDPLCVAFSSAAPPSDVICRLKSTDRPIRFLDEIENLLKARARRSKAS